MIKNGTVQISFPIWLLKLMLNAETNLVESNLPEGYNIISIYDNSGFNYRPENRQPPTEVKMIISHKDFPVLKPGEQSPLFDFQYRTYADVDHG